MSGGPRGAVVSTHRRNPYRAPDLPAPPPAPRRLDYSYPHKSVRWGDHPPHDGSCDDYDGWVSPWELPEVRYDDLGASS